MTVTIYEGYDKTYVILDSKDERFRKKYGSKIRVNASEFYYVLSAITTWANNDLGESCLFEIG